MLGFLDPDAYETVSEYRPCTACDGDMRKCTGACNGMMSIGHRMRSPDEVARIKADRLRMEEDSVLLRAAEIQMQRTAAAMAATAAGSCG